MSSIAAICTSTHKKRFGVFHSGIFDLLFLSAFAFVDSRLQLVRPPPIHPLLGCWTRRGAPRPSRVSAVGLVREPAPAVRHPASFGSVVGFDWGSVAGQLENKSSSRPSPPLSHLPHSPSCLPISSLARACDTGTEPDSRANRKGRQADDPSHHRWGVAP